MTNKIFKSKFWLKFKNDSMEMSYRDFRSRSMKTWINNLSITALLVSFINMVIQVYFVRDNVEKQKFPYTGIIKVSYITLTIHIILTISILLVSNIRKKKILYYIQNSFLAFAFFCINFSYSHYKLDPQQRYNLHGLESLIKIFNNVGFFEYMDCFIVTVINISWVIPLFFIFNSCDINGFIVPYVFFVMSYVSVSYFIVYMRKTSFYYSEENRNKMHWFRSIIENMKSGFIHIKNYKISFMNKVMKEIVKKIPEIVNIIEESGGLNPQEVDDDIKFEEKIMNSEEITRIIFSNLLADFDNESFVDKKYANVSSNDNINLLENNTIIHDFKKHHYNNNFQTESHPIINFEKYKKLYSPTDHDKFTLLGTKTFPGESQQNCISYEVYSRYIVNKETNQDDFEIIFNDITNAKQIEEKRSEIKYKSLFLSKVAHEFKNPLICIIELVNQLSENFKQIRDKAGDVLLKFEDNLHQINSLSNYMMILIKDFDYYSQKKILMKNIPLEKEECEMNEILRFCKEIAQALLKKNGKSNSIIFEIEEINNIPQKIITDEYRLKQVLVNLISNSIKFTNQGKVVLKIERKESELFFNVTDTGKGIDIKNKNDIFAPYNYSFTRSNSVNQFGSGLGLSIILDLTKVLGKQIDFTSEVNKGSDFFFSIPIIPLSEVKRRKSSKSNSFFNRILPLKVKSSDQINLFLNSKRSSRILNKYSLFKNSFISDDENKEDQLQSHSPSSIEYKIPKNDKSKSSQLFSRHPIIKRFTYNYRLENPIDIINYSNENQLDKIEKENESYSCYFVDANERSSVASKKTRKDLNFLNLDAKLLVKNGSNNYEEWITPLELNNNNRQDKNEILKADKKTDSTVRSINFLGSVNNSEYKALLNPKLSNKNLKSLFHKHNTDNIVTDMDTRNKEITPNDKKPSINDLFPFYNDQFINILSLNTENQLKNYYNIILTDDEKLTRSFNKRLISDYATKNNLKINLIEAEDGIECLYLVYLCIKNGVKLSCIISDQTMTYMDGSLSAKILKDISKNQPFMQIPFYIITAYEDENTVNTIKSTGVTKVYSKPIKKVIIEEIFKDNKIYS